MRELQYHVWASRLGSGGPSHAFCKDGSVVSLCGTLISAWDTSENPNHCETCSHLLPVDEAKAAVHYARETLHVLIMESNQERARQKRKAERRSRKIAKAREKLHKAKDRLKKARS